MSLANPAKKPSFKPSKFITGQLFYVLCLACISTQAQAASTPLESDANLLELSLEELLQIPVTSFRNSVVRARDLKRIALIQQDAIVSEDIADFPDLNLAEALQRVPGVAISREGGEGRQITLRGLSANYSRVTINGVEALAQSSTTLDSRDTISTSRAFDFNVFSADLFSQMSIAKSYSADKAEGGIAASVELRTAKPFDFDGPKANLSLKLGDNQYTSDSKPQVSFLLANTWDTLGALFAVNYSERDTVEQGYSTSRWRTRTTTNIGSDIDEDTAALLAGGLDGDPETTVDNLWFARLNRYSYWANTQERLGINSSLQYKPNDKLNLTLDLLYAEFNNNKREHHLATSGSASTALGRVDALEYVNHHGDLEVVYGKFSDLQLVTESRIDQQDTQFYNLALNGDWQISDSLHATAMFGKSSSELQIPVSDKVYLQHQGGITTDYREDNFYGKNSYDFDPADLANWSIYKLDLHEENKLSEINQAKADLEFTLSEASLIKLGMAFTRFNSVSGERDDQGFVSEQATPLNTGTAADERQFAKVFTRHKDIDWVVGDVKAAQKYYGLSGALGADSLVESGSFSIKEATQAAYGLYQWQGKVLGYQLHSQLGLRYFSTQVDTSGLLQASRVQKRSNYGDFLPTLNLVLDLNPQNLLRLSISQNITRPDTDQLSPSAIIRNDPNGPSGLSIQAGNPDLRPIKSTNVDLAYERYFNDIGYFSVAAFTKLMDRFVVDETRLVPYSQTGYGLEHLGPGQDGNTIYAFARPVNSDSTRFNGLEFSFYRDLDFLPEPFNHFGVISNYTLARGQTTYRNVQASGIDQTKDFIGLSRNAANFTLYYEMKNWGARISANYRDKYIFNVEGGLSDEDERGYHAATRWDFSSFYKIGESLKLTLEGVNLTNEREEQYSDSSDRLYGTTYSGASYFVGVSYSF